MKKHVLNLVDGVLLLMVILLLAALDLATRWIPMDRAGYYD